MKHLKEHLLSYLETLLGSPPDLVSEKAAVLPLFLRERYRVFSTHLVGRRYLLALEIAPGEVGSPGDYSKQVETMRRALGEPVVLVLRTVPSYARNRMVQMGVPFIIPGNQMYLPNCLIDLRERLPQPAARPRETLSPAAQCTVLYHLLRGPLEGISLKDVSRQVEYSQMMLTKVKQELEMKAICKAHQRGRSLVLEFLARGRSLWELANPHLGSPVKRTHWVRWTDSSPHVLLAGMSALSRLTKISDDRLPTFALPLSTYRKLVEKGTCIDCPDAEHATASLQVWSYNPLLLGNDTIVDPLSLYLSLRSSGDERVEQHLQQLLEVIW
jgi:hypothetical protein